MSCSNIVVPYSFKPSERGIIREDGCTVSCFITETKEFATVGGYDFETYMAEKRKFNQKDFGICTEVTVFSIRNRNYAIYDGKKYDITNVNSPMEIQKFPFESKVCLMAPMW